MEFFDKKGVRLRSHLDKYLVADEDQQTVRQSRNGSTRKARWIVEIVETNSHVVRLRSCYGRYLTASSSPFLLGMTGNKVLQTVPENMRDFAIEWQPIRDGFQVKIRGFGGKYLRANGGTLPWRNSVTHDNPHSGSTNNWILWTVEGVDIPEDEQLNDYLSMVSSFSSVSDELSSLDGLGSPFSNVSANNSPARFFSTKNRATSFQQVPAMDLFHNAKAVRIRSSHGKYLTAQDDEESVTQDKHGSTKAAKWTVELLPADHNNHNIIRLKSCYNKYLTASNHPFLLGMTGRKVLQTMPDRLDSSVEWEPLRDGDNQVKFRTRYGQFLRANGGLPPWRNSITHDIPQRTATQDWIFWYIDVVEIVPPKPMQKLITDHSDSFGSTESSTPNTPASFSGPESADSFVSSPPKRGDGRLIFYHISNEFGDVDEDLDELVITFKGTGVEELTKRLEEETGLTNITVCSRSPLNGKLYPLRLQLPPNNVTMNVVVVQSS